MTPPRDDLPHDLAAHLVGYRRELDDPEQPVSSDDSTNVGAVHDQERQRRYQGLTERDKEAYRAFATAFLHLLAARHQEGKRTIKGALRTVQQQTGWTMRAVQRKRSQFAAYLQRHLTGQETVAELIELGAPCFVPVPRGRKQGQNRLTEDEKHLITYAVLSRTRITRSVQQVYRRQPIAFSYGDVYQFLRRTVRSSQPTAYHQSDVPVTQDGETMTPPSQPSHFGDPQETNGDSLSTSLPSYDTVRRYTQLLATQMPALFARGTVGQRYVEEKLLLKRPNDVAAPHLRWQSDVMDLYLYVLFQEQVCPVSLLLVYDDYSRYILWWQLIARATTTHPTTRQRRKTSVTTRLASTAFATAMYQTGTRCEVYYTDHGAYYEKSAKGFYVLTQDDEPAVAAVHTHRGRPEGRGKIENVLGKTKHGLVARFASHYRTRADIRAAQQAACTQHITYEEVQAELGAYFATLNQTPRRKNGTQTRAAVWQAHQALPAPPIRHLAQLPDIEALTTTLTIRNNWVVSFHGQEWVPKETTPALYYLWADAVARQATVRVCAVKLASGWVAEICLDETAPLWVELVPKDAFVTDSRAHMQTQQAVLTQMERDLVTHCAPGVAALQRAGGMPVMQLRSGTYDEQVADPQQVVQHSRTAVRRTKQRKPRPMPPRKTGRRTTATADPAPARPPNPPPGAPPADRTHAQDTFATIWAQIQRQRQPEAEEP